MLVGSGPSTAAGLPSWTQLATKSIAIAVHAGADQQELEDVLAEGLLPEVFQKCADVVGIQSLCDGLGELMNSDSVGSVYPILARWPIACYMTTNFDDLLLKALTAQCYPFVSKGNSSVDMVQLRADTRSTVFKLHGGLQAPDDVVLTRSQYDSFDNSEERKYWRDVLFSILRNVDVLIVGYSVSDPNFQSQLEWARELSAPNKPVFLLATGLSSDRIDELYTKFNIRVLEYDNADGCHRELIRVLRRYDPFIAGRESAWLGLDPIDEDEARLAGALHVFTKTRVEDDNETCLQSSYCALTLSVLARLPQGEVIALSDLLALVGDEIGALVDPPTMNRAIEHLYHHGYIAYDANESSVHLLKAGAERIAGSVAERNTIEERFDVACRMFLGALPETLGNASELAVVASIKHGIVEAFDHRGLEIASASLTDREVDVSTATDILSIINKRGGALDTLVERAAFADLTIKVLLEPGPEIKEYLASVSQGYFAYHALGWDTAVANERLAVARQRTWVLDSSILLFLLADGCLNHAYAEELLSRMSELGLAYVTSERLLNEVEGHARWAISRYVGQDIHSLDLLRGVAVTPGHRQNLFVDGFVRWADGRGTPTLARYLEECIGTSTNVDLRECLLRRMASLGIEVRSYEDWPAASSATDWFAERDDLAGRIRTERERRGTYRNMEQCTAEAEVILLARYENAAFLTPSSVLRGIADVDHRVNWSPEALFRFLSLFSTRAQNPETLYESMIETFFYPGFDIVDSARVTKYASGLAHQARIQLEAAREDYAKALDEKEFAGMIADFESVPDEQKPFYSMQFAHYVAVRASRAAEAAKRQTAAARTTGKLDSKEKEELDLLRAKEAQRKRKALKRARKNQSKPKRRRRK